MAIGSIVALGVIVAGCGGGGSNTASSARPAAPKDARVTITHAVKGCHDWAVNGGKAGVNESVRLVPGGSVTITNNDVMPHTLIQTHGPVAATADSATMGHAGAASKLVFPNPGTYTFTTKAGEDYPSAAGLKTVGEDHNLKLSVVVAS